MQNSFRVKVFLNGKVFFFFCVFHDRLYDDEQHVSFLFLWLKCFKLYGGNGREIVVGVFVFVFASTDENYIISKCSALSWYNSKNRK